MNDVQLATRLVALAATAGADDAYVADMQIAIDHSDPFYAIADGVTFLVNAGAAVPSDVAAAYATYRTQVTDSSWYAALPIVPLRQVA